METTTELGREELGTDELGMEELCETELRAMELGTTDELDAIDELEAADELGEAELSPTHNNWPGNTTHALFRKGLSSKSLVVEMSCVCAIKRQ